MNRTNIFVCELLLILIPFIGCGSKEEPASKKETPAPEISSPVNEATSATLVGKVLFEGTPPRMKKIDMAAEPTCQNMHPEGPYAENVLVNENGTLRNVFVYVKSGLENLKFSTPPDSVLLNQNGCHYDPHIFGIQVGQPLRIQNSDSILHNIHTMPKLNTPINVAQPKVVKAITKKFEKGEVMIPIKCDVHGWMSAYVGVLDHPYHSVTGADGTFELKSLPPGEYTIEAWHEEYGSQTQTITVGEKETKEIAFTFKPKA